MPLATVAPVTASLAPERLHRWRCWRCGAVLGEHNLTPGAWWRVRCRACLGEDGADAVNEQAVDAGGHVRTEGWAEPKRRKA